MERFIIVSGCSYSPLTNSLKPGGLKTVVYTFPVSKSQDHTLLLNSFIPSSLMFYVTCMWLTSFLWLGLLSFSRIWGPDLSLCIMMSCPARFSIMLSASRAWKKNWIQANIYVFSISRQLYMVYRWNQHHPLRSVRHIQPFCEVTWSPSCLLTRAQQTSPQCN